MYDKMIIIKAKAFVGTNKYHFTTRKGEDYET